MAKKSKKMTAFDHGRVAARLPPQERGNYRQVQKAKEEGQNAAEKDHLDAQTSASASRQQELREELASRGNISQKANNHLLFIAFLEAACLAVCCVGELSFTKWMIEPFGFGSWLVLWSIAVTIMIVSLETVDRFLKWHRAAFPDHTKFLFLTIFSMCLFAVIFMILQGGEIRGALFPLVQDAQSPDLVIKQAEQFYSGKTAGFMWLMVTLTGAFTLMAGATYHDVKHRIPQALTIRGIHKGLQNERKNMENYQAQYRDLDARAASFDADFEAGVLHEMARQANEAEGQSTPASGSSTSAARRNFSGAIKPLLPLIIILLAILFFFLLKSKAFSDEHLVLLDISKSETATGYQGINTEFQKNLEGVIGYVKTIPAPKDFLRIIAVTGESFSRPHVLIETFMPNQKGYFGEVLAKKRLEVIESLKAMQLKPVAESTDIIGAVNLAELYFSANKEPKRLIIFSDMRQCGEGINFEKAPTIKVDYWMKRLRDLALIPSLDGVSVWCLGVHTALKDAAYWRSLRDFWAAFFREAKANLITFSADRRIES